MRLPSGRAGWLVRVVVAVFVGLGLQCGNANFSCQRANEKEHEAADGCPVQTSRHPSNSMCVNVRVWIQHEDLHQAPTIEIVSVTKEIIRPVVKYQRTKKKWHTRKNGNEIRVWCHESFEPPTWWELLCDCVAAKPQLPVRVSYRTASLRCSVNYTLADVVPSFSLAVDLASKTINVTVTSPTDRRVHARWCYKRNVYDCVQRSHSNITVIDPAQSLSARLSIPHVLPCVCVQVYYAHTDSVRKMACPFQNIIPPDVEDVWRTSEVTPYESTLTWHSECPAQAFPVVASLCWRHGKGICTPLVDSALDVQDDGMQLIFNISAVDKHPQLCVKFSFQGSHNISCPFFTEKSSWDLSLEANSRLLSVFIKSSLPATFSAQLCMPSQEECAPRGPVYTVAAEGAHESKMSVPVVGAAERVCVQVWQSFPARHGRRIVCPHNSRSRWGMQATAALTLLLVFAVLAFVLRSFTKKGATAWLSIQEPVLLVCSSEKSQHVLAACALASLLRGDLSATVHVALCATSSRPAADGESGVADLGPLPWLYGQWEAVREARGKVLIVWSPEAKGAYGKWKRRRHGHGNDPDDDDFPHDDECGKLKKNGGRTQQDSEPSAVIQPVFAAALACLEGVLRQHKSNNAGVVFVYFRGLGRSGDIPRDFRGVPRYCVPRDLGGLIGELGGLRGTKSWRCWHRLLSKGVSVWLARRLARRLHSLLPPAHKTQSPR